MQQVHVGPVAYSGFPVRSLTKQLNGDGGEWITAYRVEQKKRFKTTLSSASPEASSNSSRIFRPPTNTREASGSIVSRRYTLNKSFLLSHCYVDEPSDLCVANISGVGLEYYVLEDLTQFQNVIHVNASDNKLSVDAFTFFPALEELELSLNGLVDIQLNHGDFHSLHFLNLSYNTISGLALMELGTLPSLRELHLTGNNIVALPVEMSRPFRNSCGGFEIRFPALERLWLDDNKLSDQTTFATLAGLRKLRYLNLDNNEMYTIPQLKLLGASPIKQHTHPTPVTTTAMTTSSLGHHIEQLNHNSNTTLPEPTITTYTDSTQEYLLADSPKLIPAVHVPPNTAERTVSASKSETTHVHTATGSTDAIVDIPRSKSTDEINRSTFPSNVTPSPPVISIPIVASGITELDQTGHRLSKVPEEIKSEPVPEFERREKEPHPLQADGCMSGDGGQSLRTEVDVEIRENQLQEVLMTGHIDASSQEPSSGEGHMSPEGVARLQERADFMRMAEHNESVDVMSVAPFPELETLSLVNNLLLSPEGVIACESWPALKELILYGNPFTQTCKGMPPLLQVYLVNQRGITVIRKKPGATKKHYIGSGAKEFKKVSTHPPAPIPKCLLPAIEYSPSADIKTIGYTPSLSHTGTHSSPRSFSPESTDSMASVLNESVDSDQQGVFMTQVDGEEPPDLSPHPLPGPGMKTTWSTKDDFEARRKELKNKFRDVPDKYKGYEALLDTYDDPQTKIPTDIHSCVRALQYSLKHPLVLGDRGPNISSIASSPSSTVSSLTGNYLKKKAPPLPPVQTYSKVREIQSVLDDIRTDCSALETNLSLALKPKTPPARKSISQLQRESRQLLAEMQACYNKVRASSLKSVHSMSAEMTEVTTPSLPRTPRARVRFSRNEQVTLNSLPNRTSRASRTSSRESSGH